MTLPHTLKRIRLHLARSKEFPSGSARHGYEFVAPLDARGHIDPHLWQQHRGHCGVRRFGMVRTNRLGTWSTNQGVQSTPAGYSTMTKAERTMMNPDAVLARTSLRRANMSRSATKRTRFIPFR